jgi:hypothetical protein
VRRRCSHVWPMGGGQGRRRQLLDGGEEGVKGRKEVIDGEEVGAKKMAATNEVKKKAGLCFHPIA